MEIVKASESRTHCVDSRDRLSVSELFKQHQEWARAIGVRVWKRYGWRFDIDDCIQGAYIGLWRAALKYNPEGATFKTYALRVINGAVIDALQEGGDLRRSRGQDRKRSTVYEPLAQMPESVDSADNPEVRAHRLQLVKGVRRSLKHVPRANRAVLEEHYFHERTLPEIAERHGVTKQAIGARHAKALSQMRSTLELFGITARAA